MEWQGLIIHYHEIELKLKRSDCAPKVSVRRLGWLILPVLRPLFKVVNDTYTERTIGLINNRILILPQVCLDSKYAC
jgi:hypothetical protein